MFKKVCIENFRGIDKLEIDDFKRVNLLVGGNNCGKTSVLEALFILSGSTNPDRFPAINAFRCLKPDDLNVFFYNFDLNSIITISGVLGDENEDRKIIIKKDSHVQMKGNGKEFIVRKGLDMKTFFNKEGEEEIIVKSKIFVENNEYSLIEDIGASGYKEKQKTKIILSSILHGLMQTDLINTFDYIQKNKQILEIIDILKKIEPKLSDLRLFGDQTILSDIGFNKLVPLNALGDGIIRIFEILSGIISCKDGLILIDEIDNGLHYSALNILWESIFTLAEKYNVQIFATTHSMECLSSFYKIDKEINVDKDDIRLVRIDREENNISAVSYNNKEIGASFEINMEMR